MSRAVGDLESGDIAGDAKNELSWSDVASLSLGTQLCFEGVLRTCASS